MSKTDIQNSEAKKALDYVESQRLDNLQRSVKPIFQPQDPIERVERDREIVEWAENNVAYKGDMGDGTDFKMISLYDLITHLTNSQPSTHYQPKAN